MPGGSAAGWAVVRIALGLAQMVGAVVSLSFLVRGGISPPTVWTVAVTSVLTTASVLLFGSHRSRGN